MPVTWIVVAESSRARILETHSVKDPLREVATLDHPEARMHELDLISDQPGRRHATRGPMRHGMSDPASMKEEHAQKFAREIADRLEVDRTNNRYDRLILAASPKFLGMLRGELAIGTTGAIVHEYDKNWLNEDAEKIRKHLPTYL